MKNIVIYTRDQLNQVFNEALELLLAGPIRGGLFEAFNARSLKQNATFHMWCTEIAKQFIAAGQNEFLNGDPMNMANVKKHLKYTFLPCVASQSLDLTTGEIEIRHEPMKTSELPRGEMCYFMNQVHGWAIDNKLTLTIPVGSDYHKYLQEIGEAA